MYRCGIETLNNFFIILNFFNVLIVPLWNWNKIRPFVRACGLSVLIVPLWNWNTYKKGQDIQKKKRINCTVVELKHWDVRIAEICIDSINCTVVELKPALAAIRCSSISVLIVPLWNWNLACLSEVLFWLFCINCTVVELKLCSNKRKRGKFTTY